MYSTINHTLKNISDIAFDSRLKKLNTKDTDKVKYTLLSDEEIKILTAKINLLPKEYQDIIFFKYCFKSTSEEINNLLNIEDSENKLIYIQDLLSKIMKLENSIIDEKSLTESAKSALKESMKNYDSIEILHKPDYSKSFRQKLKDVKVLRKNYNIIFKITKRIAVFVLISFLGFSTVLAVNEDIREKFIEWIVETFSGYSVFTVLDRQEGTDDLKSFKINYIPEGFKLITIYESKSVLIYDYETDDGKWIEITFVSSKSHAKTSFDTEGAVIEEITFKSFKGYIWETNNHVTNFLWSCENNECHISGNVSKEEVLKIADGISM